MAEGSKGVFMYFPPSVFEKMQMELSELSGKTIIDLRMFWGRCRQRFVGYWEMSQKLNGPLVCGLACQ